MFTNQVEEYQVRALPTGHSSGAVGFEVLDKGGKSIFYTGDAGGGLSSMWPHTNPDILIVDLTFPNELENTAVDSNHMCPRLLGVELINFNKLKGYFPKVIPIHLSPKYEYEIRKEMERIAQELGISIINVHDGTELNI